MVEVTWLPIRVETGSSEEDGRLLLADGKLVAVLVSLTDTYREPDLHGKWFVEAGFGPMFQKHEVFPTFEAAEGWVREAFENRGQGRAEQTHPGNNSRH